MDTAINIARSLDAATSGDLRRLALRLPRLPWQPGVLRP